MAIVSVVIPTYNRAELVRETVASVLQQSHPPSEVIIVDDGSTDGTAAVCAAFVEPVRYIRQENAGVSAARNRGIREARGDWIAFVDADDVWVPQKLEVQLAALHQVPEARWCASDCRVIGMDGQPVSGRQGFEAVFGVFGAVGETADAFFARWLVSVDVAAGGEHHTCFHGDFFPVLLHGNVVLPSSAVVHRSLFSDAGSFDEQLRLAEETEFFHRASVHAHGVMVMSPLVGYRVAQEGSLTNPANTPRLIRNALASIDRAAARRGALTPAEQKISREGHRRLLTELAYAELSLFNRAAARAAVQHAWRAGASKTPRTAAIFAASLLPSSALRGLHRLKRMVTATRSWS
jgi:hypothetical protein